MLSPAFFLIKQTKVSHPSDPTLLRLQPREIACFPLCPCLLMLEFPDWRVFTCLCSDFAFLYSTLLRLADVLWNSQIPLLICRTYGLVGYMRIIIKEHPGKIIKHMGLAIGCLSCNFRKSVWNYEISLWQCISGCRFKETIGFSRFFLAYLNVCGCPAYIYSYVPSVCLMPA